MAWEEVNLWDLHPKLKVVDGKLMLEWTCFRCQHQQETTLELDDDGWDIECANREVCGGRGDSHHDRYMHFTLNLAVEGCRYMPESDAPLRR